MNIQDEILGIIERHDSYTSAKSERFKPTKAEQDLDRLLEIFNDYFVPIVLAAKEVHDVRDRPGASVPDLILPLTRMSTALRIAGLVEKS